jgi:hypothetical protein
MLCDQGLCTLHALLLGPRTCFAAGDLVSLKLAACLKGLV